MTAKKALPKTSVKSRSKKLLLTPNDNYLNASLASYMHGVKDCMDLIDLVLFDITDSEDAEHTLRVLKDKMEKMIAENQRAL